MESVESPARLQEEVAEVANLQEVMILAPTLKGEETAEVAKLLEEASAEVEATILHWKQWCLSKMALVNF